VNSNLKVLHGLFGPKIVAGHSAIRPFLTVKGGFVNFRLDPRPASVGAAISSIENLRANNVTGILYPGAGLEGHIGPVGLRLEAGDEIYFPAAGTIIRAWPSDHSSVSSRKRTAAGGGTAPTR